MRHGPSSCVPAQPALRMWHGWWCFGASFTVVLGTVYKQPREQGWTWGPLLLPPWVTPNPQPGPWTPGPSFWHPVPCSPGCLHSGSPVGVAPMSRPAVWPWGCGWPRCGVLSWALEGVRGGECAVPVDCRGGQGLRQAGKGVLGSQGRQGSPASPTKTSCGGLKGPSPTALYTVIRIS